MHTAIYFCVAQDTEHTQTDMETHNWTQSGLHRPSVQNCCIIHFACYVRRMFGFICHIKRDLSNQRCFVVPNFAYMNSMSEGQVQTSTQSGDSVAQAK